MKIGNKIIHLDSVDSTSNYIAKLVKANEVKSGTVILADEQFQGRGQRDAEWVVNPGENLTFSFLLDGVNLSVEQQFFLTELVSLSVLDLLKKYDLSAQIKWPNDIFIGGKKVAGILIENQLNKSVIKSSIVGVGLNVNQIKFNNFSATSLKKESKHFFKVQDVFFSFIESFNRLSEEFLNTHFDVIHEKYLSNLYLLNEESIFSDDEGEFRGQIVNVLETGQLVVKKKDEDTIYNMKEIKFLDAL